MLESGLFANVTRTCSRTDAMKILFVIPHYYGPGPGLYGSTDESQHSRRTASLRAAIASLHQHLGGGQQMLHGNKELFAVNQAIANDIDIVVCTSGENHLLSELDLPAGSYRHHAVTVDNPLYLGYSAYDVFKDSFGKYDWYCYLEDDLVITDPLFFHKLQAFYATAPDAGYLLQPNRFEVSSNSSCGKTYIDGPMWDDNAQVMANLRLPDSCPQIDLPFLAATFRMLPAENAHSGCFFLTASHMKQLLEQPWYGKRMAGYVGPLESAATLFIMALFHVFKPADECAGFLELLHAHQRYSCE